MSYVFKRMPSPVGTLTLIASGDKLCAILWENERLNRVRIGPLQEDIHSPLLQETERQLQQYFAGEREHFDLQLDFVGTEFQQKVWQALLTIPFGETRSYSQIAQQIGNPKAVRAVGAANGKNPISIVTPCHRVIGASGSLTGFAGGLEAKQYLLGLEGKETLQLAF
ncbi:methylated-DNA--[protein]-cysteine S-methyltransferase [Pseudomonas sp. Irchel 3H3]|uniref:methylated-DNA--[protein]-cysteine S-methyltransferase n=1 Tax=Pseudomonas sp. Irchel 3H3 TaxID=2009038 RepID=UPI000BA4D487|nr:methylated-DNA--[protein]-cysteine S-methyltransferase [Pseudomonas sp. Irchel 3H3]